MDSVGAGWVLKEIQIDIFIYEGASVRKRNVLSIFMQFFEWSRKIPQKYSFFMMLIFSSELLKLLDFYGT